MTAVTDNRRRGRALAVDALEEIEYEDLPLDHMWPDDMPDGMSPGDVDAPEEDEHPEDAYEIGRPRPRPPHLRVAPKVSRAVLRRRRRARFAVLGVAAISAASMFMLVAFHVFAVQSAFQLNKLQNQLAAEQVEYGVRRAEVDAAASPATVASEAAQLGMVRSMNTEVLHALGIPWAGATTGLPVPPKTPYGPLDAADSGP